MIYSANPAISNYLHMSREVCMKLQAKERKLPSSSPVKLSSGSEDYTLLICHMDWTLYRLDSITHTDFVCMLAKQTEVRR